MLELVRKGNDVYCKNVKLTIVKQGTKGPNKEVVKVLGLEGSNGQKWVSLTKLHEGVNQIDANGREVVIGQKYVLTEDESKLVKSYQAKIDEIVNRAKARYVKPMKLEEMTIEQLEKFIQSKKEQETKKVYGL